MTHDSSARAARAVGLWVAALLFVGPHIRADTIFQHDAQPVGLSAQDNAGEVWAIGYSDEKLLRWTDAGWLEMADAAPWEGTYSNFIHQSVHRGRFPVQLSDSPPPAGAIALWPAREGGVESLWELREPASPDVTNGHSVARLFHYRHTIAEPWVRLGSAERRWVKPKDRYAPGYAENEAWKSAPFYRLIPRADHLSLLSVQPERVRSLGVWTFDRTHGLQPTPLTSIPASSLRKPRITLDASGALWLWGEQADPYNSREHPRFFTRFADGKCDSAPQINGLPASAPITEFVTLGDGRMAVAALENEGLWTIDLLAATATRRSSPPLSAAAKIWSWQTWPDGLEVALASDPEDPVAHHHEYFWAVPWVRQNGEWRAYGRFLYNAQRGSAMLATTAETAARWLRYDDHLILTGPHRTQVLALNESDAMIRPFDWRLGARGHFPSGAFILPSGQALVTGISSVIVNPGELAAALAQPPPALITFSEPVPGDDGALAALRAIGPAEKVIDYWDGQRLHRLATPEGDRHHSFKLMQDSTRRLWLIRGAEYPAWVLDPAHPDAAWQRHETLLSLVAEQALAGKATGLSAKRSEENGRPVWHESGQALLWLGGGNVTHFKAGTWTSLPALKTNSGIAGLRFSEDGFPEALLYQSLELEQIWRYHDESGWTALGGQPSRYAREEAAREKQSSPPPENVFNDVWPANQVRPRPVSSEDGTWWLLKDGELWRCDKGISRRALPATLRTPWTTKEWYDLHSVGQDTRGNYYFWQYSDVTVVPKELLEKASN